MLACQRTMFFKELSQDLREFRFLCTERLQPSRALLLGQG
jgi:hypothetical protein